jgi:hypothetical protein
MKRKGIASFRLKPYALIEKYVVPAFHQNGNIKQPTVGSLAKHFLIANSSKYMQYLEQSYRERMANEAKQQQMQQQQNQQNSMGF